MPARDLYHEHVRNALIKAGWRITHDPLRLELATTNVQIDLGAEQLLIAEKMRARSLSKSKASSANPN